MKRSAVGLDPVGLWIPVVQNVSCKTCRAKHTKLIRALRLPLNRVLGVRLKPSVFCDEHRTQVLVPRQKEKKGMQVQVRHGR